MATGLKNQEIELQKLLSCKCLREWNTLDVILWLTLVNDGSFAKYIDIFKKNEINGKILMSLDDEKSSIDLLGTQHQINTFIQCIKQLKSKNGRKMSIHRRRISRRGNSLFDGSTPKHLKSKRKYRSMSNIEFKRQRSLSHDDLNDEATDKKQLWKLYKDKEIYSAILFKRGKFNKSFKKRWLVLCQYKINNDTEINDEKIEKSIQQKPPKLQINNYSLNALDENGRKKLKKNINKKNKGKNKGHFNSFDIKSTKIIDKGYLFYFNERPIKDNDFPNGYINLSSVLCVCGLINNDNDNDNKQEINYVKKKTKESEYYEIVLKTNDREWIFGAIDSKSYIEWLIRLKRFE